jgi:transcriptional regulator with XRE-family HTH domain
MNLFLYVRQKLGITRETMAALLGTKPGLYNMAEINRRNLSPDAMDRLIWLWQTLQAFPDPETTAFSKTDLDLLLHKTRKKRKDIDQALQASETKRAQMHHRLLLQPLFLQKWPAENHPSGSQMLQGMIYDAQSFLQSSDAEKFLHQKAVQIGLEAMLAFLEAEAKKNS